MQRIHVLVASDDVVIRYGVRALLSVHEDVDVVADTFNVGESPKIPRTPADVVVVAWASHADGDLAALAHFRAELPDCGLVVLSHDPDPGKVRRALDAGADGYVLSRNSERELVRSVRAVSRGGGFIDGQIGGEALRKIMLRRSRFARELPSLSSREGEVLALLASGRTHKEVAERLNVSTKSVETYRSRAARKLGLRNRADLVSYAVKQGLLHQPGHDDGSK